jgi:Ion channel
MLDELLNAFALLAACVAMHAAGLTYIIQRLSVRRALKSPRAGAISWLLIRMAWLLAALHIAEILVWAAFYSLRGCLPDFKSAVYFSGVSYTTLGYGDVLLPREWWFLGPMEGLTGILMCGLSTGFFFAIVSRIFLENSKLAEPALTGGK